MRFFLLLVCAFALVSFGFGRSKTIKAAPQAPPLKSRPVPSSITLSVRSTSSGRTAAPATATASGAVRSTTVHGVGIEIAVANLGAQQENVTVKWFWVGRFETSRNWFRTGDGEKTVLLEPKKTEPPFLASGEIEDHKTKSTTSQYQSGGHLAGWVVTAHNAKGELVALRASDSYLEGFAAEPPPKQRQ
jgi:hypothetical protein